MTTPGVGEFDGKVALVTGGASGIGEATVAMFLARGARVASFDLRAEDSPDGALKIDGDATDSRSGADDVLDRRDVRHLRRSRGLLDGPRVLPCGVQDLVQRPA